MQPRDRSCTLKEKRINAVRLSMTEPYQPISCALHDVYEIAVMRKQHLNIKWTDDSGERHMAKVMPKDIEAKDKEEFLIAVSQDGRELCIRLDKLTVLS